jgi:fucokinase
VFTGQRRLARNILREIMGKAVANHPETMRILKEIQRLAVLMAFELEMGSVDRFALLMREHWTLSKRLDSGSSNTCIDHLVSVCEDLIDGMMICGAGGGGFMSMILQKGVTADKLEKRLASVYQESGAMVWKASFDGV